MAHLTDEQRWAIAFSWKRTQSIRATARALKLPYQTTHRWVKRYKDTKGVTKRVSTGRKPILHHIAAKRALELLLDEKQGGAEMVSGKLKS